MTAEGLLTLSGLLDRLNGLNLLHGLLYDLLYRLNRLSRLDSLRLIDRHRSSHLSRRHRLDGLNGLSGCGCRWRVVVLRDREVRKVWNLACKLRHDGRDRSYVRILSSFPTYLPNDGNRSPHADHALSVEPNDRRVAEPRGKSIEEFTLVVTRDFHLIRLNHRSIGKAEEETSDVLDLGDGRVIVGRALVAQRVFDRQADGDVLACWCRGFDRPSRDRAVPSS